MSGLRSQVIVWRVNNLNPNVASTRYRLLSFLDGLEQQGYRNEIVPDGVAVDLSSPIAAIVFVKSYHEGDSDLVRRAVELKVPIVFDLCDNIFSDLSSHRSLGSPLESFFSLHYLSFKSVIVPSPYLKMKLEEKFQGIKVSIVEDCWDPPKYSAKQIKTIFIKRFISGHKFGWFFVGPMPYLLSYVEGFVHKTVYGFFALLRVVSSWIGQKVFSFNSIEKENNTSSLKQENLNATAAGTVGRPRLLWFGNSGTWGVAGMSDLIVFKDVLEAVYRKHPFVLSIVSNSLESYQTLKASINVEMVYVHWSEDQVSAAMKAAKAVLVPSRGNDFSLSKSSNRSVLALSKGVPVMATPTLALESLGECVILDNYEENLMELVSGTELAPTLVEKFNEGPKKALTANVLTRKWIEIVFE